ncbi:MAG TPA: HNH endonuclease signature motif containing protein [Chitinophagaceae bacterium]|nr:HNH endonuclease signature motif containing protein [Chitinophagaceae bacterium]
MRLVKGNLALFDHLKNNKKVFLFKKVEKSYVEYEGELELLEVNSDKAPDTNGNERNAFKFFFKRASDRHPIRSLSAVSMPEPPARPPDTTEREGLVTSRVGQGAYRRSILYRWDFKCAVTKCDRLEILIASHIVPWRDSNNFERLDVNNGILLSPVYDALFDRHLISFENSGRIILSEALLKTDYKVLGVTGKEVINNLSHENFPYLDRHRGKLKG